MTNEKPPEVWLRGPLNDMPVVLQPAAHALMQAREEINSAMLSFDERMLWLAPGSVASPGFHLQHIVGILDRLLTYARGEALSSEQLGYFRQEGQPSTPVPLVELLNGLSARIDRAIEQYRQTDPETLTQFRGVGRKQLPSTVIGLLFHAAEHTTRHTGQLLVTLQWLKEAGARINHTELL